MNQNFNWMGVLQTVVAGIAVAGILFAFSLSARLTALEEQQKGYSIILGVINQRLDRMEDKVDILISKAHTHGGN